MGNSEYPIILNNVSFTYEAEKDVFKDMTLELPRGVVSLVGQNGSGKSTLLLLAGGRILPQKGSVRIGDTDTGEISSEDERNRLVSFVYQNMEFETEESIGELLTVIYESGFHENKDPQLIKTIIDVLELKTILDKKTGDISKGEMQRTVIAFSLLYGSKIIMMDEPVFALENNRKVIVLAYLYEYAKQFDVSIYYSIHELDLSEKYSDHVLLFTKEGKILSGPTEKLLTKDNIEQAYQVPMDMLHQRENLYRDHLLKDNIDDLKGLNTKIIE
jgi:iron complex transport system ATP-binding protein